jgi:hypothetical protein
LGKLEVLAGTPIDLHGALTACLLGAVFSFFAGLAALKWLNRNGRLGTARTHSSRRSCDEWGTVFEYCGIAPLPKTRSSR